MKVTTKKGLEFLTKSVEEDYDRYIQERKDLDIALPGEVDLHIDYSSYGPSSACAYIENNKKNIQVSTLMVFAKRLGDENYQNAQEIINYLNMAKGMFNLTDTNEALEFIENPELFMQKRVQNGILNLKVPACMVRPENLQYLIEYAPVIKDTLDIYLGMIETLDDPTIPELRHEIDHLVYFDSIAHEKKQELIEHAEEIEKALNPDESYNSKNIVELSKVSKKIIDMESYLQPIMETSAMFFSYTKYNEIKNTDFTEIKDQIFSKYCSIYLENRELVNRILNSVLLQYLKKGLININDINYAKLMTSVEPQTNGILVGRINWDKINCNTTNKILYQILPKQKLKFATNCKLAIDLLAEVYSKDSSRLKRIKEMRNLNDFIDICNGKGITPK